MLKTLSSAQILCTVWTVTLPKVSTSLYFHRKGAGSTPAQDERELEAIVQTPERVKSNPPKELSSFKLLWVQFKTSYADVQVLQWSLWYALGSCGFFQVTSYIQILWDTIEKKEVGPGQ